MTRTTVLASLLLSLFVAGCCCPKKSKAQMEKDRVEKEAEKAKEAADRAELAAAKKKCGDRFGTNDWESTCRDLVKAKLFQPSSADFSMLMSVARDRDAAKCKQTYSSTVESKNAFGATVEHRFVCTWNVKTDRVTLDAIGMN